MNTVDINLVGEGVDLPNNTNYISITPNVTSVSLKDSQNNNVIIYSYSNEVNIESDINLIRVESAVYENINHTLVNNHNLLVNLEDDDHPQYLNIARADLRYSKIGDITGNTLEYSPGVSINDALGNLNSTVEDSEHFLELLEGQVTESTLSTALNARIDNLASNSALAQEVSDRTTAVNTEINNRIIAVQGEKEARQTELDREIRSLSDSIESTAETVIRTALAFHDTALKADATAVSYYSTLYEHVEAGKLAEISARESLAAKVDANEDTFLALIYDESITRAAADSAEASQRNALTAKLYGTADGLDINQVTSGLFYQERIARATATEGLAQQITLLSAGSGDQFDWVNMWYFDTSDDVSLWGGNGTPTFSSTAPSCIRPANHLTDPYIYSPTGLAINAGKYTQVRMRILKVGSPTWDGYIYWNGLAETWDNSRKQIIDEPSYVDDIALVTLNLAWVGTVDQLRIDLSTAQTDTDYFIIDWVAVGRPSPGASYAQISELEYATTNTSNPTSIASKVLTLETEVNDPTTGLSATRASLINDYYTEANANEAIANAQTSLLVEFGSKSIKVFREISAPIQAVENITLQDGSIYQTNKIKIGDIWLDYDDGNKPHVWDGSQWVYTPDTSTEASTAYINSFETTVATSTGSYATSLKELSTSYENNEIATSADIVEVLNVVSDVKGAGATLERTLIALSDDNGENTLKNLVVQNNDINKLSGTVAFIQESLTTQIVNGLSAEAEQRTLLAAAVETDYSQLNGYINEINNVTVGTTSAVAQAVVNLNASVYDLDTDLATARADINEINDVTVTSTSAAASQLATLYAQVNTGDTSLTAVVNNIESAKIGYCITTSGVATDSTTKQTCEALGNTWVVGLPIATAVKQVSISDGVSGASLEQRFTAQKSLNDELTAEYYIKADVNGNVFGYGLSGDSSNSMFIANVDQFAITTPVNALPVRTNSTAYALNKAIKISDTAPYDSVMYVCKQAGTSASSYTTFSTTVGDTITDGTVIWQVASRVPFAVLTTSKTINGITIPAGTYIDGAIISNATITNAAIANLDADKINTGYLNADRINTNSITANKIDSRGLSIKDNDGNIILAAGNALDWGNVDGINKPADNATANAVSSSLLSARPTGADGDFYYATDTQTLYQKISGSWVESSTKGATFTDGQPGTISGQITPANASTYITSAAIGAAYIGTGVLGGNLYSSGFDGSFSGDNISGYGTTGWAISRGGKAVFHEITFPQLTTAIFWEFSNTQDGWTGSNCSLSTNSTYLNVAPLSSDPTVASPVFYPISGSANPKVRARVYISSTTYWEGKLYWRVEGGGGYSESYSLNVACPGIGWQIVEWDLELIPNWTNYSPTQIRLDLFAQTTVHQIDWVMIGKIGIAAQINSGNVGSYIKDLTIDTLRIKGNAVSTLRQDYRDYAQNITGGIQSTVGQLTFTSAGTETNVMLSFLVQGSTSTSGSLSGWIYRGGAPMDFFGAYVPSNTQWNETVMVNLLDTSSSAGNTYTWYVYITPSVNTQIVNMSLVVDERYK